MSAFNSGPSPDRLIGQEWVDHGYQITPSVNENEDCPICDASGGNCTDFTHTAGMRAWAKIQQDEEQGL